MIFGYLSDNIPEDVTCFQRRQTLCRAGQIFYLQVSNKIPHRLMTASFSINNLAIKRSDVPIVIVGEVVARRWEVGVRRWELGGGSSEVGGGSSELGVRRW